MRKFKLILAALLFTFSTTLGADAFAEDRALNSTLSSCANESKPFGGGTDAFPWSIAKPFPWTSIQGIWTATSEDGANLYFEFKVTRSTSKIKQLAVEIYHAKDCKKAYMRGVGVTSNTEKNTVRVNMNNVLLKLALFNTADLELTSPSCGYKALGATFFKLNDDGDGTFRAARTARSTESRNVLLKKISNSSSFKCF